MTIAALGSLGWSTEYYKNRQEKIASNKKRLLAIGEYEDRLDFCADLLFARENAKAFVDEKFIYPEKTILGNYITEESIFLFYETGETGDNWDVVYFRDEEGNETEIPAIAYVYNPENKNFQVSNVEEVINKWIDMGATNFLEFLVGNNVRVMFHSQAGKDESVQKMKYGDLILFLNYSGTDVSNFKSSLEGGLQVEPYGIRGNVLFGPQFNKGELAVLKEEFAYKSALFLSKKNTGKYAKDLSDWAEINLMGVEFYLSITGLDKSYIDDLAVKIKKNNLMVPYAGTWEEIDEVLDQEGE